jgi:hypothetical protein
MMPIVYALLSFVVSVFRSRIALRVEIVALRHQLALYHRSVRLPSMHAADRLFWAAQRVPPVPTTQTKSAACRIENGTPVV